MAMAKYLCYYLNRQKIKNSTAKKTHNYNQSFLKNYIHNYSLNEGTFNKYAYKSGSFLSRYEGCNKEFHFIQNYKALFKDKTLLIIGAGRGVDVLYFAHDINAKFVYGIDPDKKLCNFSKTMLKDHGVLNTQIICSDLCHNLNIKDNSIDYIVSRATFEHIMNLKSVLKESYRILIPKGKLFTSFSPIWRNYYGSHLGHVLPFPWTHLIFNEESVKYTLEKITGMSHSNIKLYSGLNKLVLKEYNKIFQNSPFKIVKFENVSNRHIKHILCQLPGIGEFISGSMIAVLEKTNKISNHNFD